MFFTQQEVLVFHFFGYALLGTLLLLWLEALYYRPTALACGLIIIVCCAGLVHLAGPESLAERREQLAQAMAHAYRSDAPLCHPVYTISAGELDAVRWRTHCALDYMGVPAAGRGYELVYDEGAHRLCLKRWPVWPARPEWCDSPEESPGAAVSESPKVTTVTTVTTHAPILSTGPPGPAGRPGYNGAPGPHDWTTPPPVQATDAPHGTCGPLGENEQPYPPSPPGRPGPPGENCACDFRLACPEPPGAQGSRCATPGSSGLSGPEALPWNTGVRITSPTSVNAPGLRLDFVESRYKVRFVPSDRAGCTRYPPARVITMDGSQLRVVKMNGSQLRSQSRGASHSWTQIEGHALHAVCDLNGLRPTSGFFNTSQAVASFVPPQSGFYRFRLEVTDGDFRATAEHAFSVECEDEE